MQKSDIPVLVDSLDKINAGILRIVASPVDGREHLRPGLCKELRLVLQELENTVRVLRVAVDDAREVFDVATHFGKQHGTRTALVLDSTQAMVRRGQRATPVQFHELMPWTLGRPCPRPHRASASSA